MSRKFWIGGFVTVVAVAVIVGVSVYFGVKDKEGENEGGSDNFQPIGDPLSFEEFIDGEFNAKGYGGKWYSDTKLKSKDADGNLVVYNVDTDTTDILVPADIVNKFEEARFLGFAPNSDKLLLFAANIDNIWRHSFEANYVVYDSEQDKELPIFPVGKPDDTKLQYAAWMPSQSQNRLIYIFDNNLYARATPSNDTSEIQLTSDGVVDEIYNGKPDWVYEEEVLSTDNAIYIDEEGANFAYARFDDTDVEEFYYTKFGDPKDPLKHRYPEEILIKYPKTGTSNPKIQLKVRSLNTDMSGTEKDVLPPTEVLAYKEYIYSTATWTKSGVFTVIWMNRIQNKACVSECRDKGNAWECSCVYEYEENDGWIDLFQAPVHKSNGEEMLIVLPGLHDDGLRYRHLAKINISSSETIFLSRGQWIVTSILNWDEDNDKVFFVGTGEKSPSTRHLYSVDDSGSSDPICLTCDLALPSGSASCEYNSLSMSPSATYYIQRCLGPSVPEVILRTTASNEVMKTMEDNNELKNKLTGRTFPDREFLFVEMESGWNASVRMVLPPGIDRSGDTKYPMLVDVYGGPDSQEVTKRWSIGWEDYLGTNYGVIYVSIDGRGSGAQSNDFLFEIYKRLGSVEILDQISVAKTLSEKFSYIDPEKIGIWGWSYGGYATALSLIKDTENVFSCGISVAPPTNWLFYDTIYTERYMRLPEESDNLIGYENGSVLDKVEALRGKKFMLNHGVADDNVHYQQSMMLIRALELADIHFEQFSYPDSNHGINNGVRKFLYHEFERFWSECFNFETTNK